MTSPSKKKAALSPKYFGPRKGKILRKGTSSIGETLINGGKQIWKSEAF